MTSTTDSSRALENPHYVPATTQLRAAPPAEAGLRGGEWVRMFGAIRHANFRLYLIGLLISIVGTWAQIIAQSWLVLDLTDSPLVLGQVSAMAAFPVLILGPWAGVVIDRTPRRTLLLITQTVQMIQAFILAWLTFTGRIQVWHIYVLSGLMGVANAFDAPTRQTFVVELVGKEDLANAIALNSTLFSLARTLGPSVGAVILSLLGTAWAFTINGISFLAIIVSLLLLRLSRPILQPTDRSPLADLLEGLRYIRAEKTVLGLMIIVLTVALFGSNFNTLLPVVVREVFQRDEIAYGAMGTMLGIGSVIGTLLVSYISTLPGRGRRLSQLNVIFPLTLVVFGLLRVYPLSLGMLVVVGISYMPQLALSNILIQAAVPDRIRGRVMSVYTLTVFGAYPIGAWIAGSIAEHLNAPLAILISAGVVVLVTQLTRLFIPALAKLD